VCFEYVPTFLRQDDRHLPMTVQPLGSDEPFFSEVSEVAQTADRQDARYGRGGRGPRRPEMRRRSRACGSVLAPEDVSNIDVKLKD
jgi:hypothetical protein